MAINSTQGIAAPAPSATGDSGQFKSSTVDASVKSVSGGKDVTAIVAKKADPVQHLQQVQESVQQLNQFMSIVSIGLHFTVDSDTKQMVVKVMNKATGEVIRQIPSEEALKLSKAMDTLQGLIIQQKV